MHGLGKGMSRDGSQCGDGQEAAGVWMVGRDGWDQRPGPPTAGSSAVENKEFTNTDKKGKWKR